MTSPERRAALTEYLRVLRDALRLQAWDFEVGDKPARDQALLDCTPDPRTWWASIRIGTFFSDDNDIVNTPEEQRQAVVHELLHLTQADLLHWIDEGDWAKPLAPDVAASIGDRVTAEIEKITDFAARAIAPSMPMPPEWPDA